MTQVDSTPSPSGESDTIQTKPRISDDLLAIAIATLLMLVGTLAVFFTANSPQASNSNNVVYTNPLSTWVNTPGKWTDSPVDAFVKRDDEKGTVSYSRLYGNLGALAIITLLMVSAIAWQTRGKQVASLVVGIILVFLLAVVANSLAAQSMIKSYNLEYALWALLIGLIISNTIGTPAFLKQASRTELFIKTGLVLFGVEVLLPRLLELGLPGICLAWIVTPIVLISTYAFGQRVLKIESRSLNMVISADMSVCGVSAAIATAAACRAKKEELSLAIGISLSFTVIMMILQPLFISLVGMDPIIGGAWIGGTIDSTGAVTVAGATLGEAAGEVAATVKMIQNILIGVTSFGVATYWVTFIEKNADQPRPGLSEIWKRFPKFVLGFFLASVVFSAIHAGLTNGPAIVDAVSKGWTSSFRSWFFCLAFVSIGLETRFADFAKYLRGGKPLVLYVCGQSFNLLLTLLMAWLMFGVLYPPSDS